MFKRSLAYSGSHLSAGIFTRPTRSYLYLPMLLKAVLLSLMTLKLKNQKVKLETETECLKFLSRLDSLGSTWADLRKWVKLQLCCVGSFFLKECTFKYKVQFLWRAGGINQLDNTSLWVVFNSVLILPHD